MIDILFLDIEIFFCSSRFTAFCRGALHSLEDNAEVVSPVDGTFQHERATAYVVPNPSVSYSSINTLCSNSKTPFKGLALTILHMCDMRTNEGEVSLKHVLWKQSCTLWPYSVHHCWFSQYSSFSPNYFAHQFQTLEVIVRSVRSINTMCGTRSFAIAVACDMEHYAQVINALGAENKEVCYIYSTGTRKNGKN